MTYTWNSTFVATPDEDTGLRRYTGRYINQFKAAMDERLAVEHNFNKAEVAPQGNHGMHKEGSAMAYVSATAPTLRPDGVTALDSSDKGRLWVDTSSLSVKHWTGSAWAILTDSGSAAVNQYLADSRVRNWNSRAQLPISDIGGIVWDSYNEVFVYCGASTLGGAYIAYTKNGMGDFVETNMTTTDDWNAICYSNTLDRYVALADSRIAYCNPSSGLPSFWNTVTTSAYLTTGWCVEWFSSANLFVAGGVGPSSNIMTSADGITWASGSVIGLASYNVVALSYSDDLSLYAAVVQTATSISIYTSSDLTTWVSRLTVTGSAPTAGIIWNDELSLFVAALGTFIYTSPDGITWTQRYTTGVQVFSDVIECPELHYTIAATFGSNGVFCVSRDGITWSEIDDVHMGTLGIRALAYSSSLQMCVAAPYSSNRNFLTSL